MEPDTHGHQPRQGRPFESLDWYRAAVRSGSRDEPTAARVRSWLTGLGFLSVHVSVFAIGIVALIAINLLRSPRDLWVDRAGAAWALLLTIHAVAIGLVWAVGLLGKEEPTALQVIPDADWRRPAASWPAPSGEAPAPPSGTPSSPATTPPQQAPGTQVPVSPPGWSTWGQPQQPAASPPASEKASWREAATWLTRRRGTASAPSQAPPPNPVPQHPPASPDGQ